MGTLKSRITMGVYFGPPPPAISAIMTVKTFGVVSCPDPMHRSCGCHRYASLVPRSYFYIKVTGAKNKIFAPVTCLEELASVAVM